MTTLEEIAQLCAEQQRLWQNYDTPHWEKRERLAEIAGRLDRLYEQKRQADADRRATLGERARR